MSSSGATYCNFTALVQIQRMDSPAKAYNICLSAEFATSPAGEGLLEIDSPERIAIPIEYFNEGQEQEFLSNAYFFCVGTLSIDTTDSTDPVLSIKAMQALVCPGEPCKPGYEAGIPLLGPALLAFDGTVSTFEKAGDFQYFSTQIWHYIGKDSDGKSAKYSKAMIWCRIPPTPRWRNFNLPRAGQLVQLQGTILGYFKACLCIDLANISYLQPSAKALPTSESPSSTPSTPRKRRLGAPSGPPPSDISSPKLVEDTAAKKPAGNRGMKRA